MIHRAQSRRDSTLFIKKAASLRTPPGNDSQTKLNG